tara:strand:+ start:1799 stop:2104 length:306 start_codon:yes stop_codon:yes gene_type:complete
MNEERIRQAHQHLRTEHGKDRKDLHHADCVHDLASKMADPGECAGYVMAHLSGTGAPGQFKDVTLAEAQAVCQSHAKEVNLAWLDGMCRAKSNAGAASFGK